MLTIKGTLGITLVTDTSNGKDFSRDRQSKSRYFMMCAWSTDCRPRVAFLGQRNP